MWAVDARMTTVKWKKAENEETTMETANGEGKTVARLAYR